ncbi:MAG TPA: prepilin-type N-terminal cleavage/methylation domain-containing protein [Polyangiales bacterium]
MERTKAVGQRARAGYTLVELMMVVMVIALSVLAFTPGFSRAMADRRVSSAARELIRVGRRARADTFGYLRAHLIWINPGTGNIQLLRGPTNSCVLTRWDLVAADCPSDLTTAPGQRCVENVFLSQIYGTAAPVRMFEERISAGVVTYGTTPRALCYAPSGVVSYGSGATLNAATVTTPLATVNTADATVGGGFVFALANGTPTAGNPTSLRIHRILFPLGGSTRALR